jgi:hypothetical protein
MIGSMSRTILRRRKALKGLGIAFCKGIPAGVYATVRGVTSVPRSRDSSTTLNRVAPFRVWLSRNDGNALVSIRHQHDAITTALVNSQVDSSKY